MPLSGYLLAPPVAADGRVYAGTDEGRLYCLDASDGRILWIFAAEGPIEAAPAVDGGVVYVGSLAGDLHALRAATGETLWTVRHGGAQEASPLVLRDRVVFAAGRPTRELRAVSKSDGSPLWTFTARRVIEAGPVLVRPAGRDLVAVADAAGIWSVIDAAAGPEPGSVPQWSFFVPPGPRVPSVAASGGLLAVCPGGPDRAVTLVDVGARSARRVPAVPPADGAAVSEFVAMLGLPAEDLDALFGAGAGATGAAFDLAALMLGQPLDALRATAGNDGAAGTLAPVFDGNRIFVLRRERADGGEALVLVRADVALGVTDGFWRSDARSPVPGPVSAPVLAGGTLCFAAGDELLAFDARVLSAGPVFRCPLPGGAAVAPAVADGRILVAGADGALRAFAGVNRPPFPPVVLEPAGGANVQSHFPVFRWSGASDPDAADAPATLASMLEYVVEPDGALAGGAAPDPAAAPGAVRVDLPPGVSEHAVGTPLPANARVAWRVRVRDAAGATSPWSAPATFVVHYDPDPPDPPYGPSVLPLDGAVQLGWSASPSPDVVGYNLYYKTGGESFAQAQVARLGAVTTASVGRLENRLSYDFMITAVDGAGNESAGVVVGAVPQPDIALDGRSGFATVQQAVDAAMPGETVELGPKTFRVAGGLALKGGVSLRGYAPHLTVLDGQGAPVVLRLAGTAADGRVAVEQLTVTGGGAGIDTGNADVLLRNLQVVQIAGPGIVTGPVGAVEGVHLTVADNAGDGVAARTPLAVFRGMIVARNGRFGVSGRSGNSVTYSTFFGNTLGPADEVALDAAPGKPALDNQHGEIAFRDMASLDYRERPGDAAVDAAHPDDPWELEPEPNGKRANQGAFGNTPYAAKSASGLPLESAGGSPGSADPGRDGPGLCFAAASGGTSRGAAGPLLAGLALLTVGLGFRRSSARR